MAFNKLLVCAVFVAAFYFASTSAAPTAMYRLLSERSGLFVEALSDGDVHAKAAATAAAAKFYINIRENGTFTFESVEYPGEYLLVDDGELKVGIPSNTTSNEKFTSTAIDTDTYSFHIPTDCYIAFTTTGDKYGACNLSSNDPEVEITPILAV